MTMISTQVRVAGWPTLTVDTIVFEKPARFARLPKGWKGPQSSTECRKLNEAFGKLDRLHLRMLAQRQRVGA